MTTNSTQKPAIAICRMNEWGDLLPLYIVYGWKVARRDAARLAARGEIVYAYYARAGLGL